MHLQTHDKKCSSESESDANILRKICNAMRKKIRCRRLAIIHHAETLRFASNCFHFINQIKQATLSKKWEGRTTIACATKSARKPLRS